MPNLNDQLFAELLAAQFAQRSAAACRRCPAPSEPDAADERPLPANIALYIERLQSENQALKIMLADALSRRQQRN